jgi:hypothetical protein
LRGAKGFHRWDNLKYFLFEYEEFLKHKARETNDKISLDDFGETTIEHVIPQHFWDNWSKPVQQVTQTLVEQEKIQQAQKILVNTLGNLTILKNGKNSSLGNKGWEQKRERFRTGSYNEIQISTSDSWDKTNIANRGKQTIKFLETKIHGLSFSTDDVKKLLFSDNYMIQIVYDEIVPVETDFNKSS